MNKKLKDVLPHEALGCEYEDHKFREFLDIEVLRGYTYDRGNDNLFPFTHKNIHNWWVLENGYAVAWNENPTVGWSFPVKKLKYIWDNGLYKIKKTKVAHIEYDYFSAIVIVGIFNNNDQIETVILNGCEDNMYQNDHENLFPSFTKFSSQKAFRVDMDKGIVTCSRSYSNLTEQDLFDIEEHIKNKYEIYTSRD